MKVIIMLVSILISNIFQIILFSLIPFVFLAYNFQKKDKLLEYIDMEKTNKKFKYNIQICVNLIEKI